jgi:hypothetical protein
MPKQPLTEAAHADLYHLIKPIFPELERELAVSSSGNNG